MRILSHGMRDEPGNPSLAVMHSYTQLLGAKLMISFKHSYQCINTALSEGKLGASNPHACQRYTFRNAKLGTSRSSILYVSRVADMILTDDEHARG